MTPHPTGPPQGLPDHAKQGINTALARIQETISRLQAQPHDTASAVAALKEVQTHLQNLLTGG